MSAIIQIKDLCKNFKSFKKSEGLSASVRDFFKRKTIETPAVKNLSFEIQKGEFVGFLGPNGAGKTTTLKMLTGILTPSSGQATVLGHVPWKRETDYKKQFALVMGQKSQLWWDLPPLDSYTLFRHMYEIPEKEFKKTLNFLTDLLEIGPFIEVQTRKLSLGQRMKAELIGALLHQPQVLFLDEPTIGLDVVSQKTIRDFLKTYNQETRATIILTSHYMEDIRRLCNRVMIIDHGQLIYDGSYKKLTKQFAPEKTVELSLLEHVDPAKLHALGKVLFLEGNTVKFGFPRDQVTSKLSELLEALPVEEVGIQEKSMEDIVSDIFSRKTHV